MNYSLERKQSSTSSHEDGPTCTVRIVGGLGNQMFQYAAARAVALRHDCPLKLDLSFYDRGRHRRFELGAFPIKAQWEIPAGGRRRTHRLWQALGFAKSRENVYKELDTIYDAGFSELNPPVTLSGYFFSEKYFSSCASEIRSELRPPDSVDSDSCRLQHRMTEQPTAALHIRRGDYVTNPKASDRFWSCTIDYYTQAMQRLPDDTPVFVFSDDIVWAKENLPNVRSLTFVDADPNQDGLRDLWLMTHAHHHIVANSSFSWWGAWLAGQEKGITVAPSKWYNDPSIDDSDMLPSNWIRI